jgi:catechol 2,3-dioxygenase-like lactoylglutathione lyase family enzyme
MESKMDGKLWNIGMKAPNMDSETAFWEKLGGRTRVREVISLDRPEGKKDFEYSIMEVCDNRLFMSEETVFEDLVPHTLEPGITHAVFEVRDFEHEFRRLTAMGAEVLIQPVTVSAGFGSRRLAFFRSPNGLVFEVMQILENKI